MLQERFILSARVTCFFVTFLGFTTFLFPFSWVFPSPAENKIGGLTGLWVSIAGFNSILGRERWETSARGVLMGFSWLGGVVRTERVAAA